MSESRFAGWKRDLVYIIVLVAVVIISIFLFFLPVVHMMYFFDVPNQYPFVFILFTLVAIPGFSLLFFWLILREVTAMMRTQSKEDMEKTILIEQTPEDLEIDEEIENKKRIIAAAIKELSRKASRIMFSEVAKLINLDEGEVEDLVVLLMADNVVEGDLRYTEDDHMYLQLPKPFKVTYEKDADSSGEESE